MEMNNDIFTPDPHIPEPVDSEDIPISAPAKDETPAETPPPRRRRKADAPVLTIESGDEIETEDAREAAAWHEIHNAYRTRRILSAPLGGIEQTDSGKTIAVVDYNGFRIVIPLKEMMVAPSAASSTDSMAVRQMKLLGNMLGAEIDFVILGIDSKSRSVVASRREAMMRKRQLFYFSPDANGEYRVREGRVVQARVIAVADKSIRVEIFGVECSIMARDLAWDWIGDAHDRFAVGDQIANGELRHKRILAHHALHNVQTSLGMNRDQSYRWLQTQMRLPGDQVHIAKCGDYLCEQIIRICENATTSHK